MKIIKKFIDRNFQFDKNKFESLDSSNRNLIIKKEKLEQEKKYYQNQKINLILKNPKKYQKKLKNFQKNRQLHRKN